MIATDALLNQGAGQQDAQMAHDGLARCINPVHTMGDGDVLFALGTGTCGARGQHQRCSAHWPPT